MNYQEQRMLRKNGLIPPLPTKKEKKPIAKKSDKKLAQEKAEKEARNGGNSDLVTWYKRQMNFMDLCEETGLRLETKIYQYAIMSICHILPKSTCKSVATHPLNRVFLIPDLHTKFDAMSWEEKEKMGCWHLIKQRLISLYPDLAENEKRHFPESVRKFIEETEPF